MMMISKLMRVMILWIQGFAEACSVHRAIILCIRSKQLRLLLGQCFLLNGFIFLGSLGVLKWFIDPTLHWLLPNPVDSQEYWGFNAFLHVVMSQILYLFWFYPMYVIGFYLTYNWYEEIAKHGFKAMPPTQGQGQGPPPGVMIFTGELVYSMLLMIFFFLQVCLVAFIPYVGKKFNLLLLAWLYAYYCYEYKWILLAIPFAKRLHYFESNWAFFAGFGTPCVLVAYFFSPMVSGSLMSLMFPLFVLTAIGSGPSIHVMAPPETWNCAGLGRPRIFFVADYLSSLMVSRVESELQH